MCEPIDDLPYEEFAAIFGADLKDFLELAGIEFGDPRHDWCAGAAIELRELAAEYV